ncbi:MAG: hypothetical protein DHS80DRAFT_32823 [Piptocephalis tieghemiana]|nr:MAG: hypothetical protein DHS80DRAFT_32823 [Piptocephalis tieghemiana]
MLAFHSRFLLSTILLLGLCGHIYAQSATTPDTVDTTQNQKVKQGASPSNQAQEVTSQNDQVQEGNPPNNQVQGVTSQNDQVQEGNSPNSQAQEEPSLTDKAPNNQVQDNADDPTPTNNQPQNSQGNNGDFSVNSDDPLVTSSSFSLDVAALMTGSAIWSSYQPVSKIYTGSQADPFPTPQAPSDKPQPHQGAFQVPFPGRPRRHLPNGWYRLRNLANNVQWAISFVGEKIGYSALKEVQPVGNCQSMNAFYLENHPNGRDFQLRAQGSRMLKQCLSPRFLAGQSDEAVINSTKSGLDYIDIISTADCADTPDPQSTDAKAAGLSWFSFWPSQTNFYHAYILQNSNNYGSTAKLNCLYGESYNSEYTDQHAVQLKECTESFGQKKALEMYWMFEPVWDCNGIEPDVNKNFETAQKSNQEGDQGEPDSTQSQAQGA